MVYSANTTSQSVSNGGIVNFGQAVTKCGNTVSVVGGNVTIIGKGIYSGNINLTLAGTGTLTVQAFKDGVAITGASATITGEASTSYAISIPFAIKEHCCCESTITVTISGATSTVTNAAICVEKV